MKSTSTTPSQKILMAAPLGLAILAFSISAAPWLSRVYRAWSSQILDDPVHLSGPQIISSPAKYEGALVTFEGWCVLDFEKRIIQMTSDPDEWILGVWLALDEDDYSSEKLVEPTFCRVDGTLRSGWAGHMGRWPAKIDPVEALTIYD